MTITHEQYLKRRLMNARTEKDNLNIQRQIDEAVFDAKNERLMREIDSIDAQLAAHGGKTIQPTQSATNGPPIPVGDNPFN